MSFERLHRSYPKNHQSVRTPKGHPPNAEGTGCCVPSASRRRGAPERAYRFPPFRTPRRVGSTSAAGCDRAISMRRRTPSGWKNAVGNRSSRALSSNVDHYRETAQCVSKYLQGDLAHIHVVQCAESNSARFCVSCLKKKGRIRHIRDPQIVWTLRSPRHSSLRG